MVDFAPFNSGIKAHYLSHVVTSGEATANAAVIATGFTTSTGNLAGVVGYVVQVWRSGVNVFADGAVSLSSAHNEITVADGAATLDLTAGDRIDVVIFGTRY